MWIAAVTLIALGAILAAVFSSVYGIEDREPFRVPGVMAPK